MKIHADKIDGSPWHGLSVREVRLILAAVPPEWIEGLVEVRLANGPGPRAYLFHGDGRLTIYSRSGTERQILVAVLSVLAAPSLNIQSTVSRSPSKAEAHRLEQFIEPIVERILAEMTPPTKRSPEAHEPWQPVPFPNDAA
jgi:hypothetical protein